MKHIRSYENYRIKKNRDEIIRESVFQVNDIYKVKTMIDLPQSLINAYVKKVKDTTGKNLRQFFGDVDIAEEIVKYINLNNLDVDKIPGNALMGGAQGQGQTQTQTQPQVQVEGEAQTQGQPQPQAQGQNAQNAQPQAQGQNAQNAQPQAQGQNAQPSQNEFEEPNAQGGSQEETEEEREERERREEEENELPL